MAERRREAHGASEPIPPRTSPAVDPAIDHAGKLPAKAGPRRDGGRVRAFHCSQALAGLGATYSVRVEGSEAVFRAWESCINCGRVFLCKHNASTVVCPGCGYVFTRGAA